MSAPPCAELEPVLALAGEFDAADPAVDGQELHERGAQELADEAVRRLPRHAKRPSDGGGVDVRVAFEQRQDLVLRERDERPRDRRVEAKHQQVVHAPNHRRDLLARWRIRHDEVL
ncbi:MAG TPA: hypothetical protein VK962_01720 [Actinomycetota bacterium]|nr:hypothetical protein [Actinomycetota bacterium]